MKKIKSFLVLIIAVMLGSNSIAGEEISAYYSVGVIQGTLQEVKAKVKTALLAKQFKPIGAYHPEGKSSLYVIAFTRKDLQLEGLKNIANSGALVNALRVGFVKKSNGFEVSFVNPEYVFRGYFGKTYSSHQSVLQKVSSDFKVAMKTLGTLTAFGGSLSVSDLEHYHYMMGMPYFDDPVKLKEFSSFDEGFATITKNLAAKKGGCVKVYQLSYAKVKVAVFGVGLLDKEKGEAHFMPIIGEDHLSAMPYEIILINNKATMLHGRFRFALYWPTLTMGTFTKIMSTPGDVEDQLKLLTR